MRIEILNLQKVCLINFCYNSNMSNKPYFLYPIIEKVYTKKELIIRGLIIFICLYLVDLFLSFHLFFLLFFVLMISNFIGKHPIYRNKFEVIIQDSFIQFINKKNPEKNFYLQKKDIQDIRCGYKGTVTGYYKSFFIDRAIVFELKNGEQRGFAPDSNTMTPVFLADVKKMNFPVSTDTTWAVDAFPSKEKFIQASSRFHLFFLLFFGGFLLWFFYMFLKSTGMLSFIYAQF